MLHFEGREGRLVPGDGEFGQEEQLEWRFSSLIPEEARRNGDMVLGTLLNGCVSSLI